MSDKLKSTNRYLQPEQHYINLCDKFTIEECRNIERYFNEKNKLPNKQGLNKEQVRAAANIAIHISTHCCSGERALKKDETIQEWMRRDREKDERLENATTPRNISCRSCGELMTCEMKDLYDWGKGPTRVLFLFRCQNCRQGRGIFDNGQEWEVKREVCPQCQAVLFEEDEREGKKIFTTYKCLNCDYTKRDVFNLSVEKEAPDPNFERDRARFCFTKEQTQRYLEHKIHLENFSKLVREDEERKKNKTLYDAVAALKKLNVDQLEKTINDAIQDEEYTKLEFSQPEIDKYVIIPFTVQDTKVERDGRSSELKLRRLLRGALENTNWRLMNSGVEYRLGVLSGRLKGYERESDLIRLIKQSEYKAC
ncbi:MAG: hypothetical protein ABIH36_00595 [bacterium]